MIPDSLVLGAVVLLVGCGAVSAPSDGGAGSGGGTATFVIGACPGVTAAGVAPIAYECPASLPMTSLGGTIVPGTYHSSRAILGRPFRSDAGCAPFAPMTNTIRLRLAATSNPKVFDFDFASGALQADGGLEPGTNTGRGTAELSSDGQSIAFGPPTCGSRDAGFPGWEFPPRVFIATPTTIAIDALRSTVPDAGAPLSDEGSYLIELSRE